MLAPYVMLSMILAHLNHALRLPPFSLLLVSMCISDGAPGPPSCLFLLILSDLYDPTKKKVMTLVFFYRVRDTGSWLQIGESITFFFMSSLLFLFSAGMSALGESLMKNTAETRLEACVFALERRDVGRNGDAGGNGKGTTRE